MHLGSSTTSPSQASTKIMSEQLNFSHGSLGKWFIPILFPGSVSRHSNTTSGLFSQCTQQSTASGWSSAAPFPSLQVRLRDF